MRRLPRRRRWQLSGGILAALAGCGVLIAGLATAADTTPKYFTATISVDSAAPSGDAVDAWAGSQATVTIRIKNDAFPQTLGSANITVPQDIVGVDRDTSALLPSGSVIKLRDLNLPPGATTTKTVDARIPCVPNSAGYTWKVEVKQSNDFSGTGNDFVLNPSTAMPLLDGAGLCKLEFAAGPTSAQRSSNITAVPYLTSGASVLVKVLDGSQKPSAPVTWWPNDVTLALAANPALGSLGGTVSVRPGLDGIARFPNDGTGPNITKSAVGYTLKATSDGITTAPPISDPFDIVDTVKPCTGGQCSGNASNGKFDATVTTDSSSGDLIIMSIGAPGLPSPDCQDYVETTDALLFDVRTTNPDGPNKTVLYTIPSPIKSAAQYDVCFQVPADAPPFTTKSLTTARLGLLPDCRRVGGVAPCVADRGKAGKAVVLTISAPKGDPWLRG